MTKLPIPNDPEHTRVDSSRTYKEAKTAETLLNILEGASQTQTPEAPTKLPGEHSLVFAPNTSWSLIK